MRTGWAIPPQIRISTSASRVLAERGLEPRYPCGQAGVPSASCGRSCGAWMASQTQYTMAHMLRQQQTLTAFQGYFTAIVKAQPGGAFQQQDPFVFFLIVPLAFRRHMAPGDDALHQQPAV